MNKTKVGHCSVVKCLVIKSTYHGTYALQQSSWNIYVSGNLLVSKKILIKPQISSQWVIISAWNEKDCQSVQEYWSAISASPVLKKDFHSENVTLSTSVIFYFDSSLQFPLIKSHR